MTPEQLLEEINAEQERYKRLYDKLCCMIPSDLDYEYCKNMITITQKRIDQLLKQAEITNDLTTTT